MNRKYVWMFVAVGLLGLCAMFVLAEYGVTATKTIDVYYNDVYIGQMVQGEANDELVLSESGMNYILKDIGLALQGMPGDKVNVEGTISAWKTDGRTGEVTMLAENKHNLMTNLGLNWIRGRVNGSTVSALSNGNLSLSASASAPSASWTQLPGELDNTAGFGRVAATYANNGTGKWNLTYTWTATGTQYVQLVGSQWDSTSQSDLNLFSAGQITNQTYNLNDTLTLVYSFQAS